MYIELYEQPSPIKFHNGAKERDYESNFTMLEQQIKVN